MSQDNSISRRQFIGVAGGVLGASALASISLSAAASGPVEENKAKIAADNFTVETNETDVLIIGGGIAGLFAAVRAHDAGAKVMMVSKGRLGSSGLTPFGKGVFCFDKQNSEVTVDEFVAKVSESAMNSNNAVFTRQLAEHSYDHVQELKSWGFFDSPLCNKSFMRPMTERNIPLHERVMITHLIKENDRIVGASGFSQDEEKIYHFLAKTVVLCTGSGGFKPNGFPMCDITHDGTIMAYKQGAVVTGKEWNDGHPASAENSGSCYDNWHGQIEEKPSLTSVDVHHDLGMDMNYRAYALGGAQSMGAPGGDAGGPPGGDSQGEAGGKPPQQQQVVGGPYVPEAFRRSGPPPQPPEQGFFASLFSDKAGGPPGMQGPKVGGSTAGMAIHKSEGLVPIDENGQSTLAGLWAAGDALGSYMSGGIYTQIGGSMAGSAIQGAFAGKAAAIASKEVEAPASSISSDKLAQIEEEILAPVNRKTGYSPAWVTQVLQGVMIPNFVLYIKKERMMQGALAYIEELKEHHAPMLIAEDLHKLRLAHETENMILAAEMKLRASMERKESRLSHYRLDYPEMDTENWEAWLHLYKDDDGQMKFFKQPFDAWPKLDLS